MGNCGTVTVVRPFDPNAVGVSNCTLGTQQVAPGEAVQADAEVINNNESTTASVELTWFVNGTAAQSATVTVPPRQRRTGRVGVPMPDEPRPSGVDVTVEVTNASRA
jgi:hypothetical protein